MKRLLSDDTGSVIPLLLFIFTIFGAGALYTLFFTEFAFPTLDYLIPSSDSKVFIYMLIYALPIIILLVGVFALFKEGLKRTIYGGYY